MDRISRSIGRERPETLYVAFKLNAYKNAVPTGRPGQRLAESARGFAPNGSSITRQQIDHFDRREPVSVGACEVRDLISIRRYLNPNWSTLPAALSVMPGFHAS